MINGKNRTMVLVSSLMVSALLVVACSGCGAMAQLMYVIKGHAIPAAYDGLAGKRVAVVCVSEASAFGPDALSHTIAKVINMKLAQGVKKIQLVPQSQVDNWIDQNGWDNSDFVGLGQGVKADRVVAIEIGSYSIHEGQTIYKGKADVSVTVHALDGETGPQIEYIRGPNEFVFPKNGHPAMQSSDRQFESLFLSRLTKSISDQFIKHDQMEDFATDALME